MPAGSTLFYQSLGDGRALHFSGMPEQVLRAGFERVFVERGGKVYFAYKNPVGRTSSTVRLNLPAANALFQQLGVPLLNPVD